jgi:uncharacterized protein (TIGR00251 family)
MPAATIEVHVRPKASHARIVTKDGTIKIYVTAAPEKGRANSAVIEMIARRLEVPKGAVSIISGERSRTKLLSVDGLSEAEVRRRLGGE